MTRRISLASGALAAFLSLTAAAEAQDFYKGKDITILVGSGAGGGYDTYSRTLARFWGKHIPGNPNIIVQNMPGANGVKMMNHLVQGAAKDGTVIGSAYGNNVTEPVVDQNKVTQYDSRKVNWIGNIAPQYNACFVRKDSKTKTIQDAMKFETNISATGANSNAAVMANVYNTLLGTKFKVINGYTTAESVLAIERKEVDGSCLSYDSLLASFPRMIEEDQLNWLVVLSPKPVAALPKTPLAVDFAKNDEDKQVLELMTARNLLGRPYVAAPEVPPERLAILRTSFMETMKDPAYIAEMKRAKMAMEPVDHVAMEKMVAGVYAIPPAIVKRATELTKEE
jgi:tripartite-type tricarboxylate transporter receptor subunit TctC